MDNFIANGEFYHFVVSFINKVAEEKIHQMRWDVWLHKIFDMDFEAYVRLLESEGKEKREEFTDEKIVDTINDSRNMLDGFIPD